MKLTAQQIEQIKQCASPEDVLDKAKELGLQMTLEEAKEAMKASKVAELNAEDLEQVAGGDIDLGCNLSQYDGIPCKNCGKTNTVCKEGRNNRIKCYCNDCKTHFLRFRDEEN